MNYSGIKHFDIADGPGTRTALFVSGCRHHCRGCFNESTWAFDAGEPYTQATEDELVQSLEPRYVAGLTVLGGEPLEPENQPIVLALLRRVREERPGKSVWLYTGFVWEDLVGAGRTCRARTEALPEILHLLDVLVDGPFVLSQKDISLRFRGSANQRLIDVPATLASPSGEIVPWQDEPVYSTHTM